MASIRFSEQEYADILARRRKPNAEELDTAERVQAAQGPSRYISQLEVRFAQQITEAKLPPPVREYYFLNGRDFRLDFAWPDRLIAVEVQGMAHRIKGRFNADIEKRALAMLKQWRVLEVSGATIRSGQAIEWLHQLMKSLDNRIE